MSLAISQRFGDGNTLITKKEAQQEKNMQTLVNFVGSIKNHTPSFNRFIEDNPWLLGNGQKPKPPFTPFGNEQNSH
jgi:hypothetical protein